MKKKTAISMSMRRTMTIAAVDCHVNVSEHRYGAATSNNTEQELITQSWAKHHQSCHASFGYDARAVPPKDVKWLGDFRLVGKIPDAHPFTEKDSPDLPIVSPLVCTPFVRNSLEQYHNQITHKADYAYIRENMLVLIMAASGTHALRILGTIGAIYWIATRMGSWYMMLA